ncbi:MAG: two-component regulator propeller domain-containing protein [Flavobacteriaceae bacterium]
MKNGLTNDYVVDIEGDKDGYIWFATEEGLNRYDGNTIVPFYKSNEHPNSSLKGNELNKILDDPNEKIMWIATKREGLAAYNYETNTFIKHSFNNENTLSSNAITDIETASNGNLWLATYNKGIDYFNRKENKITHYNTKTVGNLTSNYSWDIVDNGNGLLYIGHKDAGLSVIEIATKTAINYQHIPNSSTSIPGNDVRCVYKDKSGSIWVGTDKGLALFNPSNGNFTNFGLNGGPLSRWITDIAQLSDNKLWVSTRFDGIVAIDLSERFLPNISEIPTVTVGSKDSKSHLSSLNTRCIYQDKFGNVWAGTWGGGVNLITETTRTFGSLIVPDNYFKEQSIANSFLSVSQDKEGYIWAGTYGAGIFKFKDNTVAEHFLLNNQELNANTIQVIHSDEKANLWLGIMSGGILLYNKNTKNFKQIFPDSLKNSDVTAICKTKDGKIMVGTNDNGIFLFDTTTYNFIGKLNIKETLIRQILIDDDENILIGTYGIGMRIFSKALIPLHSFHVETNFISNTINHIYKDSKGNIWVATGNGLVLFDNGYNDNFKIFGAPHINTRAILEDKSGNIWYSTNKGISCVKQDKGSSQILSYNYEDNLEVSSFSSACALKSNSDELYFGSLHGISYFNPANILAHKTTPKPFFSLLNVYEPVKGQFINEKQNFISNIKSLKLNHSQNNFKISFGVKDFSLKNQIEYSYMLKGQSDLWYPVLEANEITFRNLSPGSYELLLRSRIKNQDWPNEHTALNIRVAPPFWLTWWAKLFYFLACVLIVLGFMYYREHKIKLEFLYQSEKQKHENDQKLNDERLRFYTNITHELRTPLTLILGPIEDMLNSSLLAKKDKKRLSLIYNNTIRLRNLVNRLLDFRKTETSNKSLVVNKSNIVSVVTDVGMRFKELNQNPFVNIFIKPSQDNITLFFDKEALTMILDNLISNAIKYTNEGSITVSVFKIIENKIPYVEINIKDTGTGISKSDLPKIFDRYYQKGGKQHYSGTGIGLALVKNLATLHEGLVHVESSEGLGTSISVLLQENNTYPQASHEDKDETKKETPEQEIGHFEKNHKIDDTVVLVVEDNRDICQYIKSELKATHKVLIAHDGRQGLNLALSYIPDIVISDIMMPEMDGLELCKRLKEDMSTCHIPIVLLTAKDSSTNKEEGYKSGADSYLTKPFSSSLLKSRIKNLISQRVLLAQKYSKNNNTPFATPDEKFSTMGLIGLDKEFLEKATKIITENISNDIDVQYLSDKMFMSTSTLYRKMKAITNLSSTEFIRKIKIEESVKLLLERKYTLTEIAYMVGINSQVYFRKCFKEEFGCTPTDYLKKVHYTSKS